MCLSGDFIDSITYLNSWSITFKFPEFRHLANTTVLSASTISLALFISFHIVFCYKNNQWRCFCIFFIVCPGDLITMVSHPEHVLYSSASRPQLTKLFLSGILGTFQQAKNIRNCNSCGDCHFFSEGPDSIPQSFGGRLNEIRKWLSNILTVNHSKKHISYYYQYTYLK